MSPMRIAWVGRLEHDKGAEVLLALLGLLEQHALNCEVAVVGQEFRQLPDAFATIRSRYSHCLAHFGYLEERSAYLGLLRDADVVLSTAGHEFQGVAVMEAVLCGCVPLLPARLAYPEIYPQRYLYKGFPGDVNAEARAVLDRLEGYSERLSRSELVPPDLTEWSPVHLRACYAALFERVGLR